MSEKYGVKDVFDVQIFQYDKNLDEYELVMEVTTASDCIIERNFNSKMNSLTIVDALVDKEFCEDVMHGKYDNTYVRIEGIGAWRDMHNVDHTVSLNIGIAMLNRYSLPMGYTDPSKVTFTFDFPSEDHRQKQNCIIDIEPKE